MMRALDPLVNPLSIAVVGASDKNIHAVFALRNLQRWPSDKRAIYAVNPHRKDVLGLPCYPSVADVPAHVDLALLLVPSSVVLEVLAGCEDAGVGAAIVNADGYAESSEPAGAVRQAELSSFAAKSSILVCGPNCLGIVNVAQRVAPFAGPMETPLWPGGLTVISQSGSSCSALMTSTYHRHLGMSYLVSSGNEAGLRMLDYLDYFATDPQARAFCLFLERIEQPARFIETASRIVSSGKPIVAITVGRSAEGRAVALAHTGSLAAPSEIVDAIFERAGVIGASSLDDALDKCTLFAQLDRDCWPRGRRLAVFTTGGGVAGIVADAAGASGFSLPALPDPIREDLTAETPAGIAVKNPMDLPAVHLLGERSVAARFIRSCLAHDSYDSVIVATIPMEEKLRLLKPLESAQSSTRKPIVISAPAIGSLRPFEHDFLSNSALPLITGVERTISALAAAVRFSEGRPHERARARRPTALAQAVLAAASASGERVADLPVLGEVLCAYDIPVVPYRVAADLAAASAAAEELGYPVVMKVTGGDVVHKTELGGVRLGIADVHQLRMAYDELRRIPSLDECRVIVQASVLGDREFYLGATARHRDYPPLVLVGLGGIFVELYRDVARCLTPIDKEDALLAIRRLRASAVLGGYRGQAPVEESALAAAVVGLSDLILDVSEWVDEIDINPAIVRPDGGGLAVVDAKAVLRSQRAGGAQ